MTTPFQAKPLEQDKAPSADPSDKSAALLAKIAELCLTSFPGLNDGKVAEISRVMEYVASTMKFRERLALASMIAGLERAPAKVISMLLRDVYAVAQPIIENFQAVDETLLVELAERAEDSYRYSIAQRRIVPIKLTDIIVEHGQNPSVFAVSRNSGAIFSAKGFAGLLVKAETEVTLRHILGKRKDLPLDVAKQIALVAPHRSIAEPNAPTAADLKVLKSGNSLSSRASGNNTLSALDELRAKLISAATRN